MPFQRVRTSGDKMATFVLVHGGWRGGWVWDRVAKQLRENGHRVYTPTLSGLAERSHLLNVGVNLPPIFRTSSISSSVKSLRTSSSVVIPTVDSLSVVLRIKSRNASLLLSISMRSFRRMEIRSSHYRPRLFCTTRSRWPRSLEVLLV